MHSNEFITWGSLQVCTDKNNLYINFVVQAIMQGVLDIPHNEYVNIDTDEALSLPDAVSADFIDPQLAKDIYTALGKESLASLIENNLLDPNSGKFIHPDTKRRMTVKEAIEAGCVYLVYAGVCTSLTSLELGCSHSLSSVVPHYLNRHIKYIYNTGRSTCFWVASA